MRAYTDFPEWYITIAVEHDGTLYLHSREDSLYDTSYGLNWALRATSTDGINYRDTDQGWFFGADWIGRVTGNRTRILGHFDGWGTFENPYLHSLERIIEPPPNYLTGDASSLSADWFDAPLGIPEPIVGTASIVQDGSHLSITDYSGDGEVYQIEAQWTGYQYEGAWWFADDPENTSPWRGQLNASGTYLHGTWENGEYSFSLVPLPSHEFMDARLSGPDPVAAISLDPLEPAAVMARNPAAGNAITFYRLEGRLDHYTLVDGSGDQSTVYFDDRWRVIAVESNTLLVEFEWADDMSSVTITENGGAPTVVSLDNTEAGLLAVAELGAQQFGLDVSALQDFIQDNPGVLAAILRGETAAPELITPPLEGRALAKAPWFNWSGTGLFGAACLVAEPLWPNFFQVCQYAVAFTGLLAAGASFLASGTILAALGAGASYALAVLVGIVLVLNLLEWIFGGVCDPCNVLCFINCTAN